MTPRPTPPARLHGTSCGLSFFVDSRLRGNDGGRRRSRTHPPTFFLNAEWSSTLALSRGNDGKRHGNDGDRDGRLSSHCLDMRGSTAEASSPMTGRSPTMADFQPTIRIEEVTP